MARLPNSFNSNEHGDMGFSAFNVKGAVAMIVDSEMKKTKDGNGSYLQLDVKVMSGKYKGQHAFPRLNLVNQSEQARSIAQAELATICRACKKVSIQDSEELHGIAFMIDTVIKDGGPNNPDQTRIVKYYPYDGSVQTEAMPVSNPQNEPTPVQQQKQGCNQRPPWEE